MKNLEVLYLISRFFAQHDIFCSLLCIKRRIVNSLFYKSFKELDPHTNFEYLVVSCYKTLDITKKNCGGHIILFKSQALKMVLSKNGLTDFIS